MGTLSNAQAEVSARLDRLPRSKFHYKLLGINGCAWAFDAFDVGLMTFVAAKLNQSWNLAPAQTGLLLSSGLFGMLAGAIVAGPLADKFGRKVIFQWTMLIFSVFSLACAYTPTGNVMLLAFFRFLVGIGLGGETPVVTSLMGEFVPSKHRGKLQGLLNSFWAIGWLAAAAVSFFFIPNLGPDSFAASIVPGGEGWRVAFVIGALPALYIFYIRRNLPESPRWLAGKGREQEALDIVDAIEAQVAQNHELPPVLAADIERQKNQPGALPVSTLFQGKYLTRTITLWCLWFFGMAGYYGLFAWLPSLLAKKGYTLSHAFLQIMLMQAFYVPNQIFSAYLMDHFGRKKLLIGNLALSAVSAIAYGWAITNGSSAGVVLTLGCITSVFVSAIFAIAYTYTPEMYPTSIRVTGTSWAAASSRVGSMLMPTVIGFMLVQTGMFPVFILISMLFLIPAVIVALYGIETKGMSLDEI